MMGQHTSCFYSKLKLTLPLPVLVNVTPTPPCATLLGIGIQLMYELFRNMFEFKDLNLNLLDFHSNTLFVAEV